jgi:hypothetical protein
MKIVEYKRENRSIERNTYYIRDDELYFVESCISRDTTLLNMELDQNTPFISNKSDVHIFPRSGKRIVSSVAGKREYFLEAAAIYLFIYRRRL